MRAHFGHQKHVVAAALQAPSQPVLAFAVVVLPAVVEEGDARVYGLLHHTDGLIHAFRIAQMVPAHAQNRNVYARFAERLLRYLPRSRIGHRQGRKRGHGRVACIIRRELRRLRVRAASHCKPRARECGGLEKPSALFVHAEIGRIV